MGTNQKRNGCVRRSRQESKLRNDVVQVIQDVYELELIPEASEKIKISKRVDDYFGSCRWGEFYDQPLISEFFEKLRNRRTSTDDELFFLDIGANTGSFCFLTNILENTSCFCYEPNQEVYEILTENVILNNLENKVECHNVGIWESNCEKEIKIPGKGIDSGLGTLASNITRFSSLKEGDFQVKTIKCVSVDSHMKDKNIQKVDAIKIDTEGAELPVLRGCEAVLKRDKPLLLLEYTEKTTNQFGYKREDIVHYLIALGYNNFWLVGEGDLIAE
tara:strand:- start:835 stop:1659 length:825 start_codon:yes stop_codon:yes gene_type:complete